MKPSKLELELLKKAKELPDLIWIDGDSGKVLQINPGFEVQQGARYEVVGKVRPGLLIKYKDCISPKIEIIYGMHDKMTSLIWDQNPDKLIDW